MKKLATILLIIIGLTSCIEKPAPIEKSNTGEQVLGFTLNGQYISYYRSLQGSYVRSYYNEDGTIQIYSVLDNSIWQQITIQCSTEDISIGVPIKNVEFTLEYIYSITHNPNGELPHRENRNMEDISGELLIRHWDKELKILSGNFSFTGNAPQNNGDILEVSVTDGLFDVRYQ